MFKMTEKIKICQARPIFEALSPFVFKILAFKGF